MYEALELRDGGSDWMGKGVSKAVSNVNDIIAPALVGKDPVKQQEIDDFMVQELDGTTNEWGWCKQKVRTRQMCLSLPCTFHLVYLVVLVQAEALLPVYWLFTLELANAQFVRPVDQH